MDTTKLLLILAIIICGATGYYVYQMSEDVKQLQEQAQETGQKVDSLMSAVERMAGKADAAGPGGKGGLSTKEEPEPVIDVLASYELEDRYVRFQVELPEVVGTQEGDVVVNITVDEMGVVKKTSIGKGTTIKDKAVLEAARKAALKTGFNISIGAALQAGTITYTFVKPIVVKF